MTSVTTTSDQDPSVELEKTINEFNALVKKPESSNEENLWYAWRFLQVYSVYGLRLPHTEASLKLKLGISKPDQFDFFETMKEGYNEIHEACDEFVSQIFPKVIEVGTSLLDFASDASKNGGDVFSVLIELIDNNDTQGALELLGDLQETTKTNKEKAGTVTELLGSYKGKLTTAKAKVDDAQKVVQEDDRTSENTLNKLNGGPEIEGSIKNLNNQLTAKEKEYKNALIIATTTPTYAFAGILGMLAIPVVASIYGVKAGELADELNNLEDEIEKANAELKTAFQTKQIQNAAIANLDKTEHYTDLAITHTTTVQNAWEEISTNLSSVAKKVTNMTTEKDEQTVLKTKALVKNYAKNAGEKWALLIPPLKELTRDPYIVVEDGEKSFGDLAKEIKKEIAKQAA